MTENKSDVKPAKAPQGPGRRKGPASMRDVIASVDSLKRVMKLYFKTFPKLAPLVGVCILVSAFTAAVPAVFQQKVLKVIEGAYLTGDWEAAKPQILHYIIPLICLYALALTLSIVQSQVLAYMTQKFLAKMRDV